MNGQNWIGRAIVAETSAGEGGSPRWNHVNSLAKGLEVLRIFGQRRSAMTLSEVAEATGMTAASARRMLLTLKEAGYVVQEGRRFNIAPRVLDLGYGFIASNPVWQIALPVLERLSDMHRVSAAAAVLDGVDALYTLRANAHQVSQALVITGTRLPAHVTAMGRVLLAALPDAEFEAKLAQIDFAAITPTSVGDADTLRAQVAEVRRQGYAIVDGEMSMGLRAVAVPLRRPDGRVMASLNACGNRWSLEVADLKERLLPVLIEAAENIRRLIPG